MNTLAVLLFALTCFQFAAAQQCGPNEQYSNCSSANQPYCDNRNPISPPVYVKGCECISEYIRDVENGTCISIENCTSSNCQCPGEHEIFVNCTACQPTCLNPNSTENCSEPCTPGCICMPGFVRDDTIFCIPENQCGPVTQPPCNNSSTTPVPTDIIPNDYIGFRSNRLHIQKYGANKRHNGANQDRHHSNKNHDRHHSERKLSRQNKRKYGAKHHEAKQHEQHHAAKHHEAKHHEAKHHEAKYHEAKHHEVKHHEAKHHEAKNREAKHHEDKHHEARHHEAKNHEVKHHEAKHHESKYHESKHHEAKHHEAKHHEAQHHESKHHEAKHHEAKHHEVKLGF